MSETRTSRLRWIFLGPQGLRAGWGLLLYGGVLWALGWAFGKGYAAFHPAWLLGRTGQTLMGAQGVLCLLLLAAAGFMAFVERRPLGAYGFGGGPKLRLFLKGTFWGGAALTLLILLLRACGLLAFGGLSLGAGGILFFGATSLVGFLIVGFFEEFLMRGYLQFTLARGFSALLGLCGMKQRARATGFWGAAFLLSLLFGLGHGSNGGESPLGLVTAGLAGLLFCASLWYSGSLWWAMGFHMAWDWAQTFLFGAADSGMASPAHALATRPVGPALWSGGATGPEGSLLVLPVLLAMAIVVRFTLGRSRS